MRIKPGADTEHMTAGVAAPHAEPIAIVGMAGRFPGAPDLDTYWKNLCAGVDAITEIPPDRYDIDAIFESPPSSPGRTSSRWGGFLDRIDEFDAQFFGISPREASRMDPQQRLLLEVGYEAIEDAGQSVDDIAGSNAGTFIGQLGGDYWHLQYRTPEQLEFYGLTGAAARAMTSGRLAFAFDLRGPSMTVDTACSSSLTAVHLAVQAIRAGECELALAGASNLVLLPEEGTVYSGARMLADDGRCKFGDASADGFVRSDGVGMVVLKPLRLARRDGDRVRAVILGSAVGNDGQSSGYLVTPGVDGQRRVLERAHRQAGIASGDLDYLEAHGTGTKVGDAVELEVFGSVLGSGRPPDQPCLVGSVKTNIGHAEAAAGMAGLIKAILVLQHGVVPPNLHQHSPNPAIPWDALPIQLPRELVLLPDRGRPPLAGVSSFGLTGTNAHVVVTTDHPGVGEPAAPDEPAAALSVQLLPLSGNTPEARDALARSYLDFLASAPADAQWWRDVVHCAASRRTHHDSRVAVVADSPAEAAGALRDFLEAGTAPGVLAGDFVDEARPRIAFVFPGQGSQWIGMGRELLDTERVFLDAMRECDQVIAGENGWSVIDLLRGQDTDRFTELDVIQPTLWAMEVALAALWRSWGIEPDVVLGHSMGESAAAVVAGALSLADSGAVICRRSRIAKRRSGHGTMAWVELSSTDAAQAIAGHEHEVSIAAANSPSSTLLSGDREALAAILGELDRREVFNRWINVDFASHGPQMDEILDDLRAELGGIRPRPGTIPIHSTLLNDVIDGSQLDAHYWARNIREPVDFVGSVTAELAAGPILFIEISPHPVLVSSIDTTIRAVGGEGGAAPSLRREERERATMLTTLGTLYARGVYVDWAAVTGGGRFVDLPRYPWQRNSYWFEPRDAVPAPRSAPAVKASAVPPAPTTSPLSAVHVRHTLLGAEVSAPHGVRAWESSIDLTDHTYLADHQVQGVVVFPGTGYVELAAAAAREVLGDVPVAIGEVTYHEAIFLDPSQPTSIRTTLDTIGPRLQLRVHSRAGDDGPWTLNGEAVIDRTAPTLPAQTADVAALQARCSRHQDAEEFYARHAARGNQWIGSFRGVREVWVGRDEALAALSAPPGLLATFDHHRFHPALLDAAAHMLVAARPDVVAGEDGAFVLGGIDRVLLYRRPSTDLWSHAVLRPEARADSFTGDIRIFDTAGALVVELLGLRLQYLLGAAPAPLTAPAAQPVEPRRSLHESATHDDWLHDLAWIPVTRSVTTGTPASSGTWLVLTDSGPVGRAVVQQLRDRGRRVFVATAAATRAAAGTDRYRVHPGSRDDLLYLLREASAEAPIDGIVHLWSLDATPPQDAVDAEVQRAQLLACHSVVALVQALDATGLVNDPRLWMVTGSAQAVLPTERVHTPFQATTWGLGRTLAAEHPALRPSLIDLDHQPASLRAAVEHVLRDDEEDQVAFRDGTAYAARLARRTPDRSPTPVTAPEAGEIAISVTHVGLASPDSWTATAPGSVEAAVHDVVGVVEQVGPQVQDFRVGDRVVTLAEGALTGRVVVPAAIAAHKPNRLSDAEAATIPHAFLSAYHALVTLARLEPDEHVVVHHADGHIGTAAAQIAQALAAEVHSITSNADAGPENTYDAVLTASAGEGADVVVQPPQGPSLLESLPVLATAGRYVAFGRSCPTTEPEVFERNLSIHAVDIDALLRRRPARLGQSLRQVCLMFDQGLLRPSPHRLLTDVAAAHLAGIQHGTGKVVVELQEQPVSINGTTAHEHAAAPVRSAGTYLITGGLGGIGARLAGWLVDNGARHLLLTGRTQLPPVDTWDRLDEHDPRTAGAAVLQDLASRGADVEYAAVDVADVDAMRVVLDERARSGLPALRGVFHAAGSVDYTPIRDLRPEDITSVTRSKVDGGWALHQLTREQGLDYFVLFSSAAAILGSPLLGSYAAGNAFLDALAHQRAAHGLPATVINWGFWSTVGMMARKEQEDHRVVLPRGMAKFSPDQAFEILGDLLGAPDAPVSTIVLPVDWQEWARNYPQAASAPLLRLVLGNQPANTPAPRVNVPSVRLAATSRARAVTVTPEPAPVTATPPAAVVTVVEQPTSDVPNASEAVQQHLVELAAEVLGLRTERVSAGTALKKMGMDSLMAMEFRTRIEREFGVKIPPAKMLSGGSITKIGQILGELGVSDAPSVEPPPAAAPVRTTAPDPDPKPVAVTTVVTPPAVVAVIPNAVVGADVQQRLIGLAADVLGLRADRVSAGTALKKMGMDSLMAMEFRTRIEREFGVKIPPAKMLSGGSITKIAEIVDEQSSAMSLPGGQAR